MMTAGSHYLYLMQHVAKVDKTILKEVNLCRVQISAERCLYFSLKQFHDFKVKLISVSLVAANLTCSPINSFCREARKLQNLITCSSSDE